jgi:MoxR-like ATPase
MTDTKSLDIEVIQAKIQQESAFVERLLTEVGRVIVGQKTMIERLLIGLLADGHVLMEGVPGLAKTLTVKTLAQAIDTEFRRLQFTPDLLPADLTGTLIYDPKDQEFKTKKGPIFANIILADEINRSPAKVQAALLEAMQEHQVTIGEKSYPLDDPFLVLATQNPIEQEGTYPLPEAQLDRFMFQVFVDYPDEDEEFQIVRQTTATTASSVHEVLSLEEILALQQTVRRIPAADHVIRYAMQFARLTRREKGDVPDFITKYVSWGAGPRASQYLILGAKARAMLKGRAYVSTDDVRAVAAPVLRHRIVTNFNAEAEGVDSDEIVRRLAELIPAGAASAGVGNRIPPVFKEA